MDKSEYKKRVYRASPKSEKPVHYSSAFFIGGLICVLGQAFYEIFIYFKISETTSKSLVALSLILLAAILTDIGVFGNIAKFAGAGTLVPITGFANSVIAPAVEYKTEGFITGTAVNMFKIAGPVIVYGSTAGVIYGIIYYLITRG